MFPQEVEASSLLTNQIKTAPTVCHNQRAPPPTTAARPSCVGGVRGTLGVPSCWNKEPIRESRHAAASGHLAAFRLNLPSCRFGERHVSHFAVSICNAAARKRALIYRRYDLSCGIN